MLYSPSGLVVTLIEEKIKEYGWSGLHEMVLATVCGHSFRINNTATLIHPVENSGDYEMMVPCMADPIQTHSTCAESPTFSNSISSASKPRM